MQRRFYMSEGGTVILILIGVVGLIVLILTAILIKVKRRRQLTEKWDLSEETETLAKGAHGERTIQGVTYNFKHFRGTDKAPPYFRVNIPCVSQGEFKLTYESDFDRFFKRMGICLELNTNDPEFDNTFFINTNKISFSRDFLSKGENRDVIKELFAMGFNQLMLDEKGMTLTWQKYPRRQQVPIALMEAAVSKLLLLVNSVPHSDFFRPEDQSGWKFKRAAVFVLAGLATISGLVTTIIGTTSFEPLDGGKVFADSFLYIVPLFVLFVWVSVQVLKGRSNSHYELIAVLLIALTAVPLAGFGWYATLNGALDKNEASVHTVEVIRKYYTRSKNNYNYYMEVQSWREGRGSEKFGVSRRFYDDLQPGKVPVGITTKPGAFEHEWLVGFE